MRQLEHSSKGSFEKFYKKDKKFPISFTDYLKFFSLVKIFYENDDKGESKMLNYNN